MIYNSYAAFVRRIANGLVRRVSFYLTMARRSMTRAPQIEAFGISGAATPRIDRVYVINLDRRPDRWKRVQRELARVVTADGEPLLSLTVRVSASDAKTIVPCATEEVGTSFPVADRLFVFPRSLPTGLQPETLPPIQMTAAEIAMAHSHLGVWKAIANAESDYALVLEDDIYFERFSAGIIDAAWRELCQATAPFDMLYLSYMTVPESADIAQVSSVLLRPRRGLVWLSGYVLSKAGARKLIRSGPIRGPTDLWVNHHFATLEVFATSRSVIGQRPFGGSDNEFSVMPPFGTDFVQP